MKVKTQVKAGQNCQNTGNVIGQAAIAIFGGNPAIKGQGTVVLSSLTPPYFQSTFGASCGGMCNPTGSWNFSSAKS
jgi:hypothetical protein